MPSKLHLKLGGKIQEPFSRFARWTRQFFGGAKILANVGPISTGQGAWGISEISRGARKGSSRVSRTSTNYGSPMGAGLAARGERLGGPTAREVDVRTQRQHSDSSRSFLVVSATGSVRSARESRREKARCPFVHDAARRVWKSFVTFVNDSLSRPSQCTRLISCHEIPIATRRIDKRAWPRDETHWNLPDELVEKNVWLYWHEVWQQWTNQRDFAWRRRNSWFSQPNFSHGNHKNPVPFTEREKIAKKK